MADTKITALAAITTVDPAADVLPIVDISDTSMAASGTTKKITSNQILGSGGTATLASATITGDLTVDTSTLKVDSANDRVGVGTASPAVSLDVIGNFNLGATSAVNGAYQEISFPAGAYKKCSIRGYSAGTTDAGELRFYTAPAGDLLAERYKIDSTGVATWSNVGGVAGTAMTLNATGLVVGAVSALSKLTVAGSNLTTASWGISSIYSTDSMAIDKGGSITFGGAFTGTTVTYFAQISGRKENSTDSDVAGYLALSSRPTGGLTTDRMRVKSNGQIRFIPLAADPSGAEAGDVYYNSTDNKLKCYNGTTWNDLF